MLTEFSGELTPEQKQVLAEARAQMTARKPNGDYVDKSKADLWLNRVKKASEAYKELQALCAEFDDDIISVNEHEASEDLPEDPNQLPPWPIFRDNFILEWMQNRIVVTTEEADKMFDTDVNDALAQIESQEQGGVSDEGEPSATPSVSTETGTSEPAAASTEPAPVQKRRGRPPGSSKAKKVVKAKKTARKTAKKKVAARGRKPASASSKAQHIIETYAAKGWERKRIIEKVMNQLDMGKAYASTLYQKYA